MDSNPVEIPRRINNPEMYAASPAIKKIVDEYHAQSTTLIKIREQLNLNANDGIDCGDLMTSSNKQTDEIQLTLIQFGDICFPHFKDFVASQKSFTRFNQSFLKNYDDLRKVLVGLAHSHGLLMETLKPHQDLVFFKQSSDRNFSLQIDNPQHVRIQERRSRQTEDTKVQEEQKQHPNAPLNMVPDVVSEYKTLYVTKKSVTITFKRPDDNGSPINQYKLCSLEQDGSLAQISGFTIQKSSDLYQEKYPSSDWYQFVMNFAEIKAIDFGNSIFPLDRMLYILILAQNEHGWSVNINNVSQPVCLQNFVSTTLYLKGSLRWGLFPELIFDQNQVDYQEEQQKPDYDDQTQDNIQTLCQTSFIPCQMESGRVRDACVKYSALLLNEESDICQWGEILAFQNQSIAQEAVEAADFGNVLPYNVKVRPYSVMEPVYRVTCGSYHSMCITVQGQLYAWGKNTKGQLGIGSIESTTIPVLVPFFKDKFLFIDDVRAGNTVTICKSKNGQLFTWGERQIHQFQDEQSQEVKNNYGDVVNYQCSDASFYISCPKEVIGLKVSQIAAGHYHFGALSDEGNLYVWGDNDSLCLGMKEYCNQAIHNLVLPIQLDLKLQKGCKIVEIAFGAYHCLVKVRQSKYDTVLSWGCNDMGQCGQGQVSDISPIGDVQGLPQQQIKQIDGGTNHSLFLTNDKLFGCGGNECYQLDNIDFVVFLKAIEIECLPNIQRIEAGNMVSALHVI